MISFPAILDWLTSVDGGAFIVVAAALSWAFEDMKWWQNLTGKAKSLVILGAAILVGLGTVVIKSNPALVAAIEPYAQTVIYIVGAWLVTQGAHFVNPKRRENKWAEEDAEFKASLKASEEAEKSEEAKAVD